MAKKTAEERAAEKIDAFKKSFKNAKEEEAISQASDRIITRNERVTPAETFTLSFENTSDEDMIPKLLWLSSQELYRTNAGTDRAEAGQNIYQDAFLRLTKELGNMSADRQMEFALNLERYRIGTIDRLADRYEKLKTDRKKAKESLFLSLSDDQDYHLLQSFEILGQYLNENTKKALEDFRTDSNAETDFSHRKSFTVLRDYLNPAFVKSLSAEEQSAFQNRQEDAGQKAVKGAGYASSDREDIRTLFEKFRILMIDPNNKSSYFLNMTGALDRFLAMDHDNMQDPLTYNAALQEAIAHVQTYIDHHKGKSLKGFRKERADAAKSISEALSSVNLRVSQKIKTRRSELAQKEELKSLASLHTLTATRFVTNPVKYEPEPSRASRVWNNALHKSMYGVRLLGKALMLIPMGIHLIYRGIKAISGKKEPILQDRRHIDQIPGLQSREKFPLYEPDKHSADQAVIGDTRRVPFVWEKEIPEDPNQPPTMTLAAVQAKEGSIQTTNGDSTGHGFITLRYSKKDPVSGKMTRYETTFGYHPADFGSGSTLDMIATSSDQAVNGGTVPGKVMDNSENYRISAGKTFTVTNRQINKIALAASNYAAGGYNAATRNCTTFIKDMADVAGLDTKNLFQQTDFGLGTSYGTAAALATLGSEVLSYKAAHIMKKSAQEINLDDYQMLGQDTFTEDDLAHLEGKKFNQRLIGYQPSRFVEMAKQSSDFHLNSTSYLPPKKSGNNSEKDAEGNVIKETTKMYADRILRSEYEALSSSVKAFFSINRQTDSPSNIDGAAFTEHMDNVLKSDIDTLVSENFGEILNKKPDDEAVIDYRNRVRKIVPEVMKKIRTLEENLNFIYISELHHAPELMIPFQHMFSIIENIGKWYQKEYRNAEDKISETEAGNLYVDGMNEDVDQTRETTEALKNFRYGSTTLKGRFSDKEFSSDYAHAFTVSDMAAAIQIFGSVKEMIQTAARIQLFKDKTEFGYALNENELKDKSKLEVKFKMMHTLSASFKYYAAAEHFTNGELDMMFGQFERDGTPLLKNTFQAFAWEHVMGPMKSGFREAVPHMASEYQSALRSNPNDIRNAAKSGIINLIKNLPEFKLKEGGNKEMDMISNAIIRNAEAEHPFTEIKKGQPEFMNPEAYQKMIAQEAAEKMIESFSGAYLEQMFLPEMKSTLLSNEMNSKDADNAVRNAKGLLNEHLLKAFQAALYEINPDKYAWARSAANGIDKAPDTLIEKMTSLAESFDRAKTMSTELVEVKENCSRNREEEFLSLKLSEKNVQKGLDVIYNEQLKAASDLMRYSGEGKQWITRNEQEKLFILAARAAMPALLNHTSEKQKASVIVKIGQEDGNPENNSSYDSYVKKLAENDNFRKGIIRDGHLLGAPFNDAESFRSLQKGIENILNKKIYKDIKLPIVRAAKQNPQINVPS